MIEEENWKSRTHLLLKDESIERLNNTKILIVGLGGVGAYAAEMLCRAGVGHLHIIDNDIISESNINRQILALNSTKGKSKVELMKSRLLDINPKLKLVADNKYINIDSIKNILSDDYDYIIDAIDTIAPKIALINYAINNNIQIISSMGSGGKTNPSLIQIADFGETYNDKLARIMRKRLHKWGIYSGFKVVFSPEQTNPLAVKPIENESNKKTTVGTISYMPAMFGSFMAAEIIRTLAEIEDYKF
jgi:tRNA A37 threonylcarbamoyladenosine dehydratase